MIECLGVRKNALVMMDNAERKTAKDHIKAKQKVVGLKQVLRHITESKVAIVYLASDAEVHVTEALQSTANTHAVPIECAFSRKTLGKICGIDVGAACVGILKEEQEN